MTNKKNIIAISGATGFVGTYLSEFYTKLGWKIIALGRNDLVLRPDQLAKRIDGSRYIFNLAGAPVIGRWTKVYKKELKNSRINTTRNIVKALEYLKEKPEVFISTSAVGYYDDQGVNTEKHFKKANGFLADLAEQWEYEASLAEKVNVRTVIFRLGVVLGKNGGPLQKMLLPFKLGFGGRIGSGKQAFSWLHIQDLIAAYQFILESKDLSGVFNLVSPNPTTNVDFTKTLGKVLSRPTVLPIPAIALQLLFGDGAQVLTHGQAALPKRLIESGFEFKFANLEKALLNIVL